MNKLIEQLKKFFSINDVDFNNNLTKDDIPTWDSLKHMELIAQLEKTYSIELSVHEIVGMQSISSIVNVLEERDAL